MNRLENAFLTPTWRGAPDLSPILPEREVWRLAGLMVDGYGAAAIYRAAMLADEMELRGDGAASVAWKRILRAIGELAREAPDRATH